MRRTMQRVVIQGAQGLSLIIVMCSLIMISFLGFQVFDAAKSTSSFSRVFAELLEAKTISYAAVNDMPKFMAAHDYRWLRENHAESGYYADATNFTIDMVNWDPKLKTSIAVTQPNPQYAIRYVLLRMCNIYGPISITNCNALQTTSIDRGVDGMRNIYRVPFIVVVRVQSLYDPQVVRYFDHVRVFDFIV